MSLTLPNVTLRDYFAAHAPETPWVHFVPVMPPGPTQPPSTAVTRAGQQADEATQRILDDWRADPCWDPDEEERTSAFSSWCEAWRRYWQEVANWQTAYRIQRLEQWPWFYADTMLLRRPRD
jgi:hypothetical protein